MGIPPLARLSRGGITIRLSERDVKYIAENIMPDELGLDTTRETIKVNDPAALVESLVNALNDDTTSDSGWTLIFDMIGRGLSQVFEQGEDGLDVVRDSDNEDV